MNSIETYITQSGYKKVYIAKQLGISPQSLAKRLNGSRRFYYDEVCCLIKLLNISTDEAEVLFANTSS